MKNLNKADAEVIRIIKNTGIMSDYDILTKICEIDNKEARAMLSRNKIQKLQEIPMWCPNPQDIKEEDCKDLRYYDKSTEEDKVLIDEDFLSQSGNM